MKLNFFLFLLTFLAAATLTSASEISDLAKLNTDKFKKLIETEENHFNFNFRNDTNKNIAKITDNYFDAGQEEVEVFIDEDVILRDGKAITTVIPIDIKIIGLIGLKGEIDTSKPSIKLCVNAFGFNLGCIAGNPKEGVKLNVNLIAVKGFLSFTLNAKCLFVEYDLTLRFGGIRYHGTKKILCF